MHFSVPTCSFCPHSGGKFKHLADNKCTETSAGCDLTFSPCTFLCGTFHSGSLLFFLLKHVTFVFPSVSFVLLEMSFLKTSFMPFLIHLTCRFCTLTFFGFSVRTTEDYFNVSACRTCCVKPAHSCVEDFKSFTIKHTAKMHPLFLHVLYCTVFFVF